MHSSHRWEFIGFISAYGVGGHVLCTWRVALASGQNIVPNEQNTYFLLHRKRNPRFHLNSLSCARALAFHHKNGEKWEIDCIRTVSVAGTIDWVAFAHQIVEYYYANLVFDVLGHIRRYGIGTFDNDFRREYWTNRTFVDTLLRMFADYRLLWPFAVDTQAISFSVWPTAGNRKRKCVTFELKSFIRIYRQNFSFRRNKKGKESTNLFECGATNRKSNKYGALDAGDFPGNVVIAIILGHVSLVRGEIYAGIVVLLVSHLVNPTELLGKYFWFEEFQLIDRSPFELNTTARYATIVIYESIVLTFSMTMFGSLITIIHGFTLYTETCLADMKTIFDDVDVNRNDEKVMIERCKEVAVMHARLNG